MVRCGPPPGGLRSRLAWVEGLVGGWFGAGLHLAGCGAVWRGRRGWSEDGSVRASTWRAAEPLTPRDWWLRSWRCGLTARVQDDRTTGLDHVPIAQPTIE